MTEDFILRLIGSCGGLILAIGGLVGSFLLAWKGKDQATGSFQFGKLVSVQGVSLIILAVAGVTLTLCSFIVQRHGASPEFTIDDDTDWLSEMYELGYLEPLGYAELSPAAAEEDEMWEMTVEMFGPEDVADDDSSWREVVDEEVITW